MITFINLHWLLQWRFTMLTGITALKVAYQHINFTSVWQQQTHSYISCKFSFHIPNLEVVTEQVQTGTDTDTLNAVVNLCGGCKKNSSLLVKKRKKWTTCTLFFLFFFSYNTYYACFVVKQKSLSSQHKLKCNLCHVVMNEVSVKAKLYLVLCKGRSWWM